MTADDSRVLDPRQPLRLDSVRGILRVLSGSVDIFARARDAAGVAGARTHLFRVGCGDIIIGMPGGEIDADGTHIDLLAVGGQGSAVGPVDRGEIGDMRLIETWIERLSSALGEGTPTFEALETGTPLDLEPGKKIQAQTRGVAWVTIERGEIQLMETSVSWTGANGPLAVARGIWFAATTDVSITVSGSRDVPAAILWPAIDRFNALATHLLRLRLIRATEIDAARLDQRVASGAAQSEHLFNELAHLIQSPDDAVEVLPNTAEPLLAAFEIAGAVIDAAVIRPAHWPSERNSFRDVEEIARGSQLRIRRTLLRRNWWRGNSGPLVGWIGDDQRPVALIPGPSNRYLIVDPVSGARRPVDKTVHNDLWPEAATLYQPFPVGAVSAWQLLRWSAGRARADVTRVLLAAMALGLVALVAPVITAVIVDAVIPRSDLGQLAICAAALVTASIGAACFQAIQGIATLRLSGQLDWILQAAVMDRLLRLPVAFFKRYTAGDLADRVLGIEEIRQVLTGRALGGLLAGMFSVFSFGLMFYYDWRLAVVAAILTLVHGAAIVAVSAGRLGQERRHYDLQGKVHGLVLQFVTGIGKLRVAAAATRALGIWAHQFARQKRHFIASQRAANRLAVFESAFPTLAALTIFALAGHPGRGGTEPDTGHFLAFFVAFGQSLASIANLGTAIGEMLIAAPFFTRLKPILAEPLESAELREAPGAISGAVDLNRITFRYLDVGAPILDNLSLQIASGEYLALVGPSGSGKSTIFRLILGFEQARSGTILFDGRSIDTLDIGALRRQIGVVLQNGKLTSGNIYENICGAVQVPIEQAWEAARHAGLDADIQKMPMGMHTMITEGMSALSGGQRQRLMIARALVHRPRMLLFDEATSALDNQTQSIVSAALAKLSITRVVIAHRLSTVQDADRIIVLSNGTIAQAGTFAELKEVPGLFSELAGRQQI